MTKRVKDILLRVLFSVSICFLTLLQAFAIVICIFATVWLVSRAFSEPPWYSVFYILGGFSAIVAASYLSEMEVTIFEKWAQFVQSRFS